MRQGAISSPVWMVFKIGTKMDPSYTKVRLQYIIAKRLVQKYQYGTFVNYEEIKK